MSRQILRKLQIKCLESDAFGLYSVVGNPRSVTPYDVRTACQNIGLEFEGKKPAKDIVSLVNYLLSGYFELAHRTGLYNRQKDLWESIARLTNCKVDIVRQGFPLPVKIPVVDIEFRNSQENALVLVRLVKPQKRKDFDKRATRYLSSFIDRINKLKTAKNTLTGAFICYPAPVPLAVIQKVHARTGAALDPTNRFESRLPLPANIPLNVIEMNYQQAFEESESEQGGTARLIYPEEELFTVSLVHPDLSKK